MARDGAGALFESGRPTGGSGGSVHGVLHLGCEGVLVL